MYQYAGRQEIRELTIKCEEIIKRIQNEVREYFTFDVAVLVEDNSGCYHKLVFDRQSGRYFWNQIKGSIDFANKFKEIKDAGIWPNFKDRYLQLKNLYLQRGEEISSFSVFLETLNEF